MERALTAAWFDEQSRLTPEELQTVTFPMSRLGRRGYEEEPVQGFLQLVHAEFVRLVNERASLWQEVQRLRRRILDGFTFGSRINSWSRSGASYSQRIGCQHQHRFRRNGF